MPLLTSILKKSAEIYDVNPALTMKMSFRVKTLSYKEVLEISKKIALLFQSHGVKKGDKIVICAPNSPYWGCVQWASLLLGCAIVPINIQSTHELIAKIIEETNAKIFIKHRYFKYNLPKEIKQYTIEYIDDELKNIDVSKFKEEKISEADLAILMYTSGTTGDPKGVMLTHNNIYSNLKAISSFIKLSSKHDKILSILPLSHIFEQTIGFFLPYSQGVQVIYAHSYSAIKLLMKENKISKIASVPAFLRLLMLRIEATAKNKNKEKFFKKLQYYSLKINIKFISRLLFWSVLKELGGKLNTMASGGSELDPDLEKKWTALGIDILQGYGLTETSPVVTMNTFDDKKMGSVGKVIEHAHIKISDEKEILVKGPNVFAGYFNDKVKTKEAFTPDGWFKTGDMGEIDKDGFLFIKGRKKYMILGPGGQNVYPEDIEHELNKIENVKDSCVLGLKNDSGNIEIHAVLILNQKNKTHIKQIIDKANNKLSSYQKINTWSTWPEDDFPRTVTKKIKKDDVLKYIEGKQKNKDSHSEHKKSKLVEILSRVTGLNENKISSSTKIISELNLDSLMRVELITWIEEDLGIVLDEKDISSETTLEDLEKIISKQSPSQKETPKIKKWPRTIWIVPLRIILQYLFFILLKPFVKLKIEGKDNLNDLPSPIIFMPNHLSYLDSIVVSQSLPLKIRIKSSFAAAKDVLYESYPFWSIISEIAFNSFPIERRENESIRYGLDFIGQMLDWHYSVVIYPEGQMSINGKLQELKKGAGLVATEMDVYIVPMKIQGTADIVPYGKIFPRATRQVIVKFGKPIKFNKSENQSQVIENIHKVMKDL